MEYNVENIEWNRLLMDTNGVILQVIGLVFVGFLAWNITSLFLQGIVRPDIPLPGSTFSPVTKASLQ